MKYHKYHRQCIVIRLIFHLNMKKAKIKNISKKHFNIENVLKGTQILKVLIVK